MEAEAYADIPSLYTDAFLIFARDFGGGGGGDGIGGLGTGGGDGWGGGDVCDLLLLGKVDNFREERKSSATSEAHIFKITCQPVVCQGGYSRTSIQKKKCFDFVFFAKKTTEHPTTHTSRTHTQVRGPARRERLTAKKRYAYRIARRPHVSGT